MRHRFAAIAAIALTSPGCDDSSPTAPKFNAPPNPTPAPPAAGTWTVTLSITQAVGSFCNLPSAGGTATALYTIQGEGTPTLTFAGPDIEWNSYTVAVSGLAFQSAPLTFQQSAGGCAAYTYSTRFSGTFSADRNSFTATELDTYTLTTGEVVSRTTSWSGRRN